MNYLKTDLIYFYYYVFLRGNLKLNRSFELGKNMLTVEVMDCPNIRTCSLYVFPIYLVYCRQQTGVPQGCVASVTLFLISIKDLLQLNFLVNLNVLADNIALFYSISDSIDN